MKTYPRNLISMGLMLMGTSTCFGIELPTANPARVAVEKGAFRAGDWAAASDAHLESLRGGFDAGGGLMVSFGFERTVTINGDIVSRISFNLPDVAKITADVAKTVSAALAAAGIVQNGPGNRVDAGGTAQAPASMGSTAVAPTDVAKNSSAGSSPATGVTAQSPPASLGSTAIAPTDVAKNSSAGNSPATGVTAHTPAASMGSTAVVPTGVAKNSSAGSSAAAGITAQFPTSTVIQNSLNNQTIKSLTVINAGVTSLSLFRAINVQNTLKDGILGAMVNR